MSKTHLPKVKMSKKCGKNTEKYWKNTEKILKKYWKNTEKYWKNTENLVFIRHLTTAPCTYGSTQVLYVIAT
jgi:hypothetical protein